MELKSAEKFAINAHASTNHYYDTYLPYEFHLRMVVKVATKHMSLVEPTEQYNVIAACWLHDVIEDARVNYGAIKSEFGKSIAETVRACTNYSRGRDRDERMPEECYYDIKTTPNALFVKLCDRIANVEYSKMSGSRMLDTYRKEHAKFSEKLRTNRHLTQMWDYLDELLKL